MIGRLEHWRFVRVPVQDHDMIRAVEVLVPADTRLNRGELREAARITAWLGALEAAAGLR